MEWTRVLQYLREGENLSTKFLAVVYNDQDIGPTICGMANTIGGKIFIGMDPHNFHLNGTTIDEQWVHQMIQSFFTPELHLQVEVIVKNEKRILYLNVPQGHNKPYAYRDICYVMDNKTARQATKEEVEEFTVQKLIPQDPIMQAPSSANTTREPLLTEAVLEEPNPFEIAAKTKPDSIEMVTDIKLKNSNELSNLPKASLESHHTQSLEGDVELDVSMMADELIDLEDRQAETTQTTNPNTTSEHHSVEVVEKKVILKAPDFVPPENEVTYTPVSIQQKKEAQLNERQKKALYFLNTEPYIKNKMYRELFDVSHKTAHLELVDMMGKGFIFQEGSGRSTCYKKL